MRARYASKPPQLSLLGAARSGHIVLSVVCVVALLGNVLAVGLGGLFKEEAVKKTYPLDLQFTKSHEIQEFGQFKFASQGRQNDNWFAVMANLTLNNRMPPWVVEDYYFQPFAASNPSPENSTETFSGRTRGYGIDISCDQTKPLRQTNESDILDVRPHKGVHTVPQLSSCENFYELSWALMKGSGAILGADHVCDFLFVYWGRSAKDLTIDREMKFYTCRHTFKTALFDISIDAQGHVLSHKQVGDFSDDLGYEQSRNHTDTVLGMVNKNMATGSPQWGNATATTSWYAAMFKIFGGERMLDPSEPLPDPSDVLPLTKKLWTRSYVYTLASPDVVKFAPAAADEPRFSGTRSVTETRIFMSKAAFIVSAAIFALYIAVAAALYGFSIKLFLPRMPTTIGAVLQFTATSRAVRQYSPEVDSELRFGRYIGLDGRKHAGLEYSELVMPIDTVALRARAKSGGMKRRRWFARRRRGPVVAENAA